MIKLREFQDEDVNKTRKMMRTHRRILLQEPTGAGKTIIASYMAKSAAGKGKRVYFICHRQELIDQTAKTFGKFGIILGVIWAKAPKLYDIPVQVCSIDTLKNRLEEVPEPDMVIWDECHHGAAAGWAKVMDYWPNAWHIGLSATPTRLDGKGLDKHYDVLIQGKQTAWLIDHGYLSDYTFYNPTQIDDSQLHVRMGEFVKSEAEDLMDTSKIHGDIVEHYVKKARGKRAIVFAVTVAHSKHIAEAFRNAGIMAIHLDGETPKAERALAAKAFACGDIDVISNVALFGEGYDLSAQADMDVTVDCVIDAQPTNSLSWCLQKWGRSLRPKSDGSKAIILDHANNYSRHGLPDDIREWSLYGISKEQKRKTAEEAALRTRQCPECYAIHRPLPECPECKYVYKIKSRDIEQTDIELNEIERQRVRHEARVEQGKARDVESLVQIGKSPGQAKHIVAARQEKDKLRRTLYNLVQGAKASNIDDYQYTAAEINKMKPKELGTIIDEISKTLFERSEYTEGDTASNQ